MKRFFLTFLLLISAVAFGRDLTLKEKLAGAEPGSYVVMQQGKTYTFLHIYQNEGTSLIIEEVSIPANRFDWQKVSWRDWFESGAKGNTLWLMSEIDLQSGAHLETFSFTHQGWVNLSEENAFLTTLLNLNFRSIPEEKRRRVGRGGNIWHPRMNVEGETQKNALFSAWKTRWPSDGSELSRKTIEVYLPEDERGPSFFPYWVQVEGKLGAARLRVVDSGFAARSPKPRLPRRTTHVELRSNLDATGLTLTLSKPLPTEELILLAEVDGDFAKTCVLPFKPLSRDGHLTLHVPHAEMAKTMIQGESYRFLLASKNDPAFSAETRTCQQFK